jgi:hypothetical protein
MSVLDALLGPPAGQPANDPHAGRLRSLLLDGDVLVHLRDLDRTERVVLYSVPGRLPETHDLAGRTQAWSHAVPLPADERALAVVQIEPATRQLFLAEVWPRAALDATTLGQRLDTHLAQHREWREALDRMTPEGSPA